MKLKDFFKNWWMSPAWAYQSAHFLLGVCAMTLPFTLRGKMYAELASIVLVIYGVVKEAILDPWAENEPFIWSGLIDLSFLMAGNCTAWGLYFLTRR